MSGRDLVAPVRELYEAYAAEAERLERERKPGQGIFGLPGGPKDHPCHEQFGLRLEALLARIAAQEPSSDELRPMLEYIYRAPREHRSPQTVYWMFQAVHGLTAALAEKLDPADARALQDEYAKTYRRWERLPAQKKVLAALERARKGR